MTDPRPMRFPEDTKEPALVWYPPLNAISRLRAYPRLHPSADKFSAADSRRELVFQSP